MPSRDYKFHKIADSEADLPLEPNGMAILEIEEKEICIAQFSGRWYGFKQHCPHASEPLSEGFIDNKGNVVCPAHNYKFSIINGRCAGSDGMFLKLYPVEIREDGVYIGV